MGSNAGFSAQLEERLMGTRSEFSLEQLEGRCSCLLGRGGPGRSGVMWVVKFVGRHCSLESPIRHWSGGVRRVLGSGVGMVDRESCGGWWNQAQPLAALPGEQRNLSCPVTCFAPRT